MYQLYIQIFPRNISVNISVHILLIPKILLHSHVLYPKTK